MQYEDMAKSDVDGICYYVGNQKEHTPTESALTLFVVGLRSINEIYHFIQQAGVSHVYIGALGSYYKRDGWEKLVQELFEEGLHVTFEYAPEAHHTMCRKIPEEIWASRKFEAVINIKVPDVNRYQEHITVKYSDTFGGSNNGNYTMGIKEVLDNNRLTTWGEYGMIKILATKAELRTKRLNTKKRK